jgi:hypothetical protein
MATKTKSAPRRAVDSAGQTVGRAGDAVTTAAARAREEAEDILADAKNQAQKPAGRDAAVYAGLAATAVVGVVELPLAAAAGVGYAVFRRIRG